MQKLKQLIEMKRFVFFIFLSFFIYSVSYSLPPELRVQKSLDGQWKFTPEGQTTDSIEVPDYWDAAPGYKNVKHAVYEKTITVPNTKEWSSKIIQIDFEGVNFIADVYVNEHFITSHVGGWVPFSADISKFVKPGESFTLKVDVKGGCYFPIADTSGFPLWPVGFFGQKQKWGIAYDVWLRAYGKVNIKDAFILTSVRKKEISVQYQIYNESNVDQIFYIQSIVSPSKYNNNVFQFKSSPIKLKSGESKTVDLTEKWNNPHLWNPQDPFLYNLQSEIISEKTNEILDKETRRFGFREIWILGNKYILNGNRVNFMGTNFVQHSEFYDNQRYLYITPETWNNTVDRLFYLNIRTVRFHMQPPPQFVLDIADERGLMVIEESGIYAREYVLKTNKEKYIENCKKWIGHWVIANRNHPSILVWNAENEMGVGWLKWMTNPEIKSLGDAIRLYDTSRPVNYDGDQDVGDVAVNYHYPETYEKAPTGSIYSWANKVLSNKPTGVGEFITHYGQFGLENQWWQGTWVRGMRYVGFSDIRPYRHDWAFLSNENNERTDNLRNGFSPVALFDINYDSLGIEPLMLHLYPVLKEGEVVNHILALYNDEFADTSISIEVVIKSSQTKEVVTTYRVSETYTNITLAEGSGNYTVPLGEHIEIPYMFQVPKTPGLFIDVELVARKNGELKFKESKRYSIRGISENQGNLYNKVIFKRPVK
jgi:hypothetical protein